nr:hypothetical protein [uncultured Lichenicoccus sp.]
MPLPGLCLAALLVSCAEPSSPPQQVQAANPTVTYNYRGDQELIKASQSAEVYCSKYSATARSQSITDTSDGGKSAVFECAPAAVPATSSQALIPGQTYNYQTDQELLTRTRDADAYCQSINAHSAVSVLGTNTDGSRNVSFSCATAQ